MIFLFSMSKDDIKYVACPTSECNGNLSWINENTIKCDTCSYREVLEKEVEK
jgi:hypothetical protein